MTTSHDQQPTTSEPAVPLNRAERRAKQKGKAGSAPSPKLNQKDQRRGSQVMAQPKFKGRRGDK